MRYSRVNSNRNRSSAKVISVLSFSSALLIQSCSVWQTASRCTWYNVSVLGLIPYPLPVLSLVIAFTRILTSKAVYNHLQEKFGAGWGSVYGSFEDRCKLMLTINQAHLPNQGKSVATVSLMPKPRQYALLAVLYIVPACWPGGMEHSHNQFDSLNNTV